MKIEVVAHDPSWKLKYAEEAALIKKACGDKILTIEHGGSTSIAGLAAKPIVDIYIGVKKLQDADDMVNDMTTIGYEYITKFETQLPFRRYFNKYINGEKAFHVHTVEASHSFRRDDLLFKDYLTVNENAKREYENLKLGLSNLDLKDGLDYNDRKTDFIIDLKQKAFEYFSKLYEETESAATYLMHKYASTEAVKKAQFRILREGNLTAIRTDVFAGFSLNRVLGIDKVDSALITKIEKFYEGRTDKYALQIPPFVLDEWKIKSLGQRGYIYSNSWVTFYRDSSPIESRTTDLEIREIGAEYSETFGATMNNIFSFPHEFDEIATSALGQKEWVTFMAFDGEKNAGSASICIIGETAYLSFANVLPEYRKRGIQGELLAKRIEAARERGVKWIFVDTAETSDEDPNPSYWNVLRYGFRLLYYRPNYVKVQ
jgi:GrpB-like predicted nucleotidyltransferase (UPF0157 family)/GNAT superfamily N-acetyltransferase